MTANAILFDAGSGDHINPLSTNHTSCLRPTCHFNTVKLPLPNKTSSARRISLASVGTVDGWRPKSLLCVRAVRERTHTPRSTHHIHTSREYTRPEYTHHIRDMQKSHACTRATHVHPCDHVFTPYNVALMRMRACIIEIYADALPVELLFPFTPPPPPLPPSAAFCPRRRSRPSISPSLHVQNIGLSFLLLAGRADVEDNVSTLLKDRTHDIKRRGDDRG